MIVGSSERQRPQSLLLRLFLSCIRYSSNHKIPTAGRHRFKVTLKSAFQTNMNISIHIQHQNKKMSPIVVKRSDERFDHLHVLIDCFSVRRSSFTYAFEQ